MTREYGATREMGKRGNGETGKRGATLPSFPVSAFPLAPLYS